MRVRALLGALLLIASAPASADDEPNRYRNISPDNPGGERYGDDDAPDDFDGYPIDPGESGDAYHDTSTEYRANSPNWTGAYLGVGPLVGFAAIRGDYISGVDRAPAYGAFLNWSSINQIVDAQIQYTRTSFTPSFEGGDGELLRQSVAGNLLLHPLFLAIISGPRIGYTAANTYFLAGCGYEFNRLTTPTGDEIPYASTGWRLGGGTGTYLDDPSDGGAFWLGIQFQRTYVQGAVETTEIGRQKLRENMLLVRLTYRRNGNLFSGFRGPNAP